MASAPRLLGTDVSIRIIQDGQQVSAIDAIGTANYTTKLEVKQDGFLGETTDRYDYVFKGNTGDFEFQVNKHDWQTVFLKAIKQRAKREVFSVFNVITTDRYSNGTNVVTTSLDVSWGDFSRSTSSRADFVKIKTSFSCSDDTTQTA